MINFKIEVQLDSIGTIATLIDRTGAYHPTTNPVGWGAPISSIIANWSLIEPIGNVPACLLTYPDLNEIISVNNVNDPSIPIIGSAGLFNIYSTNVFDPPIVTPVVTYNTWPSVYTGDFIIGTFPWPSGLNGSYIMEFELEFNPFITGICLSSLAITKNLFLLNSFNNIETDLKLCLTNSCNILEIYDNTSSENGCPINVNGWPFDLSDNSLLAINNVSRLYIDIFNKGGILLDTVIIIDNTVFPVINNFNNSYLQKTKIATYDWLFPDDFYKFEYKLDIDLGFMIDTKIIGSFEQFFYCQAQSCVNELWEKFIMYDECDEKTKEELLKKATQSKILLDAVKSSLTCLDLTTVENILKILEKICSLNKTIKNCGCK